jgi:hypothetical protein
MVHMNGILRDEIAARENFARQCRRTARIFDDCRGEKPP